MPTQRSFLGNFLAAFRAQSQHLPKAAASIPSSAAVASTAGIWTAAAAPQLTKSATQSGSSSSTSSASDPKANNSKNKSYLPTAAAVAAAASQDRQLAASLAPLQHNVSPQTHLPRSPSSPGLPVYGPPNRPAPSYPTVQDARRSRRGSDSSSEGFREAKGGGGEKWFIGGLTAAGEEKYYKLSMVKRERSADRISTDQLSL